MDEELFAFLFMEWIGEIVNSRGRCLAIEWKCLRGAMEKVKNFRATMVMNVIDVVTGLVLAQLPRGIFCAFFTEFQDYRWI